MKKLFQYASNPTFDEISQYAHFFSAYAVVFTAGYFSFKWCLIIAGLFLAYAAIKEFWFDVKYEPVSIRGSGAKDLFFYAVGIATAIAVRLRW